MPLTLENSGFTKTMVGVETWCTGSREVWDSSGRSFTESVTSRFDVLSSRRGNEKKPVELKF
jgi:hypothetical protein